MDDAHRVARLEQELAELRARVELLEGPPRERTTPPAPPPVAARPMLPEAIRPTFDLEELVGGRLLAWVGGLAVVVGIVFFLAMAISHGWIDEPTRTVLALIGSTALFCTGVWLHERAGRTDAARAAVGAGIFGLYATLVVATTVYDLVGAVVGLACAALVGAAATAIAVRWRTPLVGALGILGALLAPVLVDAGRSYSALIFMTIALVAAVGVLLWQRWNWLALGAFVVSTPQLGVWLDHEYHHHLVLALVVLAAFWALYLVAALGYELRTRSPERLPQASWLLLVLAVLFAAAAGYSMLSDTGHHSAAIAWIVGLALAHIVLGTLALRQTINREIGSLLIAAGLVLAAVAFADALSGPVLVVGWAVQTVVLAHLARRASAEPERFGSDRERLLAGAVIYLVLAFGHVLLFEATPSALRHGLDSLPRAAIALFVASIAAGAAAWLLRHLRSDVAAAAETLAAAGLVYLGSVAIVDQWGAYADGTPRQAGQVALSAYWALLGVAALVGGLFRDERRLRIGGLLLLALAALKVFVYDLATLEQIYRVLSFIAIGLLLLGSAFAYERVRGTIQRQEDT